jgi:hypothetical protein
MGQSTLTRDSRIDQGTATSAGGTFVATLTTSAAPFTDQLIHIHCRVYTTAASAGHLNTSCCLQAEYVVQNKNNTVSAVTAIAGSTNPLQSTVAGLQAAWVEAADTTANTSAAAFALSSSNVTMTVTNNGTTSVAVNVTVVWEWEMVGST